MHRSRCDLLKSYLLLKAIEAFHAEGFTVLLDDFGTGYSSMLFLQELEFDIMKLDCEFIWGIGEERTEKILSVQSSEEDGQGTFQSGIKFY